MDYLGVPYFPLSKSCDARGMGPDGMSPLLYAGNLKFVGICPAFLSLLPDIFQGTLVWLGRSLLLVSVWYSVPLKTEPLTISGDGTWRGVMIDVRDLGR